MTPLKKPCDIGHCACCLFLRRASSSGLALDRVCAVAAPRRKDARLENADVRCVVVHGEGRAFCAGLDVKSVMSPLDASANTAELLERGDGAVANLAQEVSYLWRTVPCPVIAAVHGVCIGGGFQIALGADVRVAAAETKFSVMEAKWGLVPDMGATAALRELTRRDVALELTTSGRVVGAREAEGPERLREPAERDVLEHHVVGGGEACEDVLDEGSKESPPRAEAIKEAFLRVIR